MPLEYVALAKAVIGITTAGIAITDEENRSKFMEAVFSETFGGIIADFTKDSAKDLYSKLKEQYATKEGLDKNSLNHDLQKAARKAQLVATFFAVQDCLEKIKLENAPKTEKGIVKKGLEKAKSLVVSKESKTEFFESLIKYLEREINNPDTAVYCGTLSYKEFEAIFDAHRKIAYKGTQTKFSNVLKSDILSEIKDTPQTLTNINFDNEGFKELEKAINNGWNNVPQTSIVSKNFVTLNIALTNDKDEKENAKNKSFDNDWFELVCVIFNEEYKDNPKIEAAAQKQVLLEILNKLKGFGRLDGTTVKGITKQISAFANDLKVIKETVLDTNTTVKEIDKKLDDHLNQRQKTIKYNTVLVPNINHRIYGRKEELVELDKFLKEESKHGAIVGLTCLGKTSLVRKYLYKNYDVKDNKSKIPEVFTDVLYIDCQQIQDFEKLLNQFNVFMRTALVFEGDDKAGFWSSEVFSEFGERKVLLIIDNFENWINDGSYKNDDIRDFVKTFLQDSGNARAIFLSWFNPHKETEFAIRVQNLTEIEKNLTKGLKSIDAIKLVRSESKQYCTENSLVDLDTVSDDDLEGFFKDVDNNPQSIQSMVHFIGRKQCTFAEFLSIYQEAFDELESDDTDLDKKRGDLDRSAKAMLNLQINLLDEKTKEILLHTAFYGMDVPHDILVWDDKDNLDKVNRLVNDHLLIRTINKKDAKPFQLYYIHNSIRFVTNDALHNFKNDYQSYLTNLADQMLYMSSDAFNNKLNNKQLALAESWYQLENYLIENRKLTNREFERDSADFYNALALQGIIDNESDNLSNDQKDKFLKKIEKKYQEFLNKYKDEETRKTDVAMTHNNLAVLLENHLGKYEEAEEQYRLAIEKDENDAKAHYNLALLLKNHLEKYEEAEEQYRLAIEKDENDAMAHNNLALLLKNHLGKYEEAEEQYRLAIEKDENFADAYGNLAGLKAETVGGDAKNEILDNLEKCLSLNPNYKDWARGNSIFEFLRDDERFKKIVGDEEE